MAQTCFSEKFREWLDKNNKIHNYNTEKIAKLYHTEQLKLCEVSNRRELLIDFFRKVSKVRLEDKGNMYTVTKAVDDYLKDN